MRLLAGGAHHRVVLDFGMKKYAKWLRSQLTYVDKLESEPFTEAFFDDLRSTIDEAEQRAAVVGLPDAVQACQIRPGRIGVDLARRILSECLASCVSDPPRDTLTVPQIASQLKVSRDTVRNWIASGKLQAANLNRPGTRPRWVVKRDDLDAFLKKRQPDPQPAKARRRREQDDVIGFF
jgi:excisionase family DNA binding protein